MISFLFVFQVTLLFTLSGSHMRNRRLIQCHRDLCLCFLLRVLYFCSCIKVVDLFWTHCCTRYETRVQPKSFPCSIQSQQHLLKRLYSPSLNSFDSLVKNQLTVNVRVDFWTLSSIPLISMCILSKLHTAGATLTLWLIVKSGSVNPPGLLFFFRIVLAITGALNFCVHFKISLSISTKKACVGSVDQLGEYCDF